MANYDLLVLSGPNGLYNHKPAARLELGLGLYDLALRYAAVGVAQGALGDGLPTAPLSPLPLDLHLQLAANAYGGPPPTMLPISSTDWAGLHASIDTTQKAVFVCIDPASDGTGPAPSLAVWAEAMSGAVDQSGGL